VDEKLFFVLVFFVASKSVDCERSDLWKTCGLVANEKNEQLDFAACWTCLQAL